MLQSILGRKTVANVLAAFNRTLEDLKVVAEQNEQEAARQAQIIETAKAEHDAAIGEAALARSVSAKLTDLVNPVVQDASLQEIALLGDAVPSTATLQ